MRFKALAVAVLVAAMGIVAPSAQAADSLTSKFLVDEVQTITGYDKQSTIEITSPAIVFCSGYCTLTVSARFVNPNPLSSPTISLITSNGNYLSSAYLTSGQRNNIQTLNFSFSANSNLDVTFHIVDTNYYKMFSGNRKLTRIQAGATPATAAPSLNWPAGTSTGAVLSAKFGNGLFRFVDAYIPDRLDAKDSCIDLPIWIQPIDISTGGPKTDSGAFSVGLAFSVNGAAPTSAGYNETSFTQGAPTLVTNKVCGLNDRQGSGNSISVYLSAIYPGQATSNAGSANVTVTGQVPYRSINCLKGKYIKTITAANPVCPAGYAKTNINPINGMVPPTTISCVKGFVVKKVTGVLPNCPAGYRRR